MKRFSILIACLMLLTIPAMAADRSSSVESGRIGIAPGRLSMTAIRAPNISVNIPGGNNNTGGGGGGGGSGCASDANCGQCQKCDGGTCKTCTVLGLTCLANGTCAVGGDGTPCREAYRTCMDDFCLLDESEGFRCSCSDRFNSHKSIINEINNLQKQAEQLYTEGVESEKLGAKAVLVFGSGAKSKARNIDWNTWMNRGTSTSLDSDEDIGDNLYFMAAAGCKDRLAACGKDADMEENLYLRQIANDCRGFGSFLNDQKRIAGDNLAAAEKAVRAARFGMLAETNRYNRGECLLAFRNYIADKGGCGENFENCLDASLLSRRANACENVLDQCLAVRTIVLDDWEAEKKMILADAAKYADQNKRATCRARSWACLEDSCSAYYDLNDGNATSSQCLNNINVAAGICPVITECNNIIPGFRNGIADDLGVLRIRFCQNDVYKCLQEKCGPNYTAPECVGKRTSDILAMCPQELFPACRGQTRFDIIISSAILQIDFQMLTGCINYFSEHLGRVCGLDMTCLPDIAGISTVQTVAQATTMMRPPTGGGQPEFAVLADESVDEFFRQFEKDITIKQCTRIGRNVFNEAKMIARIGAENRAFRALTVRMAELSRKEDTEAARKNCDAIKSSDSQVTSVVFEPSLRNCRVCRVEKVCQEGGETQAAAIAKGLAGGISGGAGMGTMVTPGWGTLIGAGVGAIGGVAYGLSAGGLKEFCQELPVCEDYAL